MKLRPDDDEGTNVLRFARELSARCECTTCMFSVDFWGGDCDDARAFVYADGIEHSYVRDATGTVTARRSDRPGARTIVGGDVLTLALLHFDVLLATGFFLPHTRSFPWADYRTDTSSADVKYRVSEGRIRPTPDPLLAHLTRSTSRATDG